MTADPVGLAEIAERLGVKPQTAQMWRHRKVMPDPRWTVSGQPAWDWPDIEWWAKKTARLAHPYEPDTRHGDCCTVCTLSKMRH
jgi:hypothetical protein